jgi:hypothetical protein
LNGHKMEVMLLEDDVGGGEGRSLRAGGWVRTLPRDSSFYCPGFAID